MSVTIQSQDLGLSVLGQAQVAYTVNGEGGKSYDQAIAAAGLTRTASIESALASYTESLNLRRKKVAALGQALADLAGVWASFKSDDSQTTPSSVSATTKETCETYGISGVSDGKVKKEDVQRMMADIQYKIDLTNNALQQDMTTVQGLVSKRDNAFSLVGKIIQKAIRTESSGIRYIQ